MIIPKTSIIPILKKFNNLYIKEDSFFIDLFNMDSDFYYFNVYFDFNFKNVLKDNIVDFKFEIIDNSKNLTQEFINFELKKENLPLVNENDSEYYQKKEIVDNFILNLKKENSVIFFKNINVTSSINNFKKNDLIRKSNKINFEENRNIKNFNYRELYLSNTKELTLNFFKQIIENNFLLSTDQITSEFITYSEYIKINKNLLNSNFISINLKVENNSSYEYITKNIDISDIINYVNNKSNIKYKFIKNTNEFIIDNELNSKLTVLKTNLLNNDQNIIFSGKNNFINALNKKNDEKNIVYTIINNNDENINYSISEYIINDNYKNYKIKIKCYNTIEGIFVKKVIENNIENEIFIIKKRDLSDKNSKFEEIDDGIDINVKIYHTYEYAVFHENDNKNYITNFIINRPNIKFSNKEFKVNVDINNDVKFNVSFLRDNENFISILKTFDLYDQYQELLVNNNQDIKNIFYYKIDRYNNDTGELYNLGWTNENFSDLDSSNKNLKPIRNKEQNYSYFITAYNVLSIMFLKENNQILVGSNNRKYLFDKNKWIHPLLIHKSISSTKNSRNSLYGKNEFEFGFASETIIVDVSKENSISNKSFSITNQKTTRKYKNYIVLEWNAENISNINHLLVTKTNHHLYEEIVDKITIKNGKNIYFYPVDNNDIKVKLNIYPITNNFTIKESYSFEEIEI